ncbi:MAG: preprotein translocase subunit SecG [Cyclobacteriaceae bacterium]|nr:preprotein translocase subunit SecG [Cyclobacteriaceae bacterium]
MLALVITLIAVTAVLLVLVVLAQNSKGGGLSSQFGGSGSSQLMGVKRTTDLMEKITWGLAIVLVILTLSTNLIIQEPVSEGFTSPNVERAQDRTVLPSLDPNLEDSNNELLEMDTTGN